MRLVPIVDGIRDQFVRYTLDQAAERLAQAHREGLRWDCRVATAGEGYRTMTEAEGKILVAAVAARLKEKA